MEKDQSTMKLVIEFELNLENVSSMLTSAFEGGSNYWVRLLATSRGPNKHTLEDHVLYHGGWADLGGLEGEFKVRLDMDRIKTGLKVMAKKYPRHFGDFMQDNADAETGDVFLQCCLFEDIIYG